MARTQPKYREQVTRSGKAVAFVELSGRRIYLGDTSQMSCLALICNLRHTLQDKGFDAFHAKVTGEPNG